jgi:two-component system NarL family sensor kinase
VALVALAVATSAAAAGLDAAATDAQRAAAQAGRGALTALIGSVQVCAAAVILAPRPRHAVGLALAALGGVWALDGLLEAWSAYSIGTGRPGTALAVWFVARFGAFLLPGLTLVLLLYPTGRLLSGRWRAVAVAVLVAACALPLALLLAPDPVLFRDGPVPGVRTDWLALPVSDEVAVAVLTASRVVTMLSLPAALALVIARHRRAGAAERTQLRWLLWAGIVCALGVLVLLLVPAGPLTTAVLALTVVLVSVSAAIGVVRPGLADVDALVAGTLTYAGVAVALVGLDLLLLAGVDRALAQRLDQREVTLLVLVVAVAVYGPLRTSLGALVRRLLFGRRGDRYGVVSSFAARLERSAQVEEQLPALAEAVASTFKVRHVRVEVYLPGGGAHQASYGEAGGDTDELDIAYRGEAVGRLVLARGGLRSLLSHRDRALLLDLARQAAIAIRAGLLAGQLQDSRERLVLAREEDRRRIRRDLHDGLGPVLGGVAMRLDAAGNAVTADPETARRLVRQARSEITDALDDVRRLVHGLRPPALDDLGLLAAIEQQADRARTALQVEVRAEELGAPPAAVEVAAFRIVSEALTNVVKHADATRCRISLRPSGTVLEVVVADDGRGIAADVAAGVGLLSLRERAEELGGECTVSCPPEGGTRVRALLPYGKEGPAWTTR